MDLSSESPLHPPPSSTNLELGSNLTPAISRPVTQRYAKISLQETTDLRAMSIYTRCCRSQVRIDLIFSQHQHRNAHLAPTTHLAIRTRHLIILRTSAPLGPSHPLRAQAPVPSSPPTAGTCYARSNWALTLQTRSNIDKGQHISRRGAWRESVIVVQMGCINLRGRQACGRGIRFRFLFMGSGCPE